VSVAELWEAVQKNHVDDVKRLLDASMSVLAADEHKNTLAHRAAEAGHLAILRLLRDRGAPLDRLNWIDQSPLSLAAWKGHLPVVKYLCMQGVPTHGPDLNTAPLSTAAAAGHLTIVQYLVEQRHVPLNALERPFGATPLFVAASFLQLVVVRYLLVKGAERARRDCPESGEAHHAHPAQASDPGRSQALPRPRRLPLGSRGAIDTRPR
jgi:ankyrin repeat protein